MVSVAVINQTKSHLEKARAYLAYRLVLPLRESNRGAVAETIQECRLSTWVPWLAQLSFLTTQARWPRDGTAYNGLVPPTSVSN